jgi:hypothetical protein
LLKSVRKRLSEDKSIEMAAECASFLWTLLYRYEKAKVTCKELGFGEIFLSLLKKTEDGQHEKYAELKQNLIALCKIIK